MKAFSICSLACLRRRTDNQKLYDYMVANGYEYTSNYSKADLMFVDTCAYCKMEEDNSVRTIKR
ncbi:hypothetical protein KKC44_03405 [Patescibacteria group bacterium]|nr:hypothetical protein [Patescibacteria group bacterium]